MLYYEKCNNERSSGKVFRLENSLHYIPVSNIKKCRREIVGKNCSRKVTFWKTLEMKKINNGGMEFLSYCSCNNKKFRDVVRKLHDSIRLNLLVKCKLCFEVILQFIPQNIIFELVYTKKIFRSSVFCNLNILIVVVFSICKEGSPKFRFQIWVKLKVMLLYKYRMGGSR